MEQPGLNGRHRNRDGEISRKHGNTTVATLRKVYGLSFAQGAAATETLAEVLVDLDEPSLTALVHDHEQGRLGEKVATASRPDVADVPSS